MRSVWFGYGMAWLSTALAVCVCIYFTHRVAPLWFMILPALLNVKSGNDKDEEKTP